jgi:mono/diheme cytochrome c family protein
MRFLPLLSLPLFLAALDACTDVPAVCSTNTAAIQTEEDESPLMMPGGDCIGCHAQGEGPRFILAGTVMGGLKDDTNCGGIAGATVVITGADGRTLTMTTNAAGNFFSQVGVVMPYTAKVSFQGKERSMVTPRSDGNCMSCHTAEGLNGAPGRIVAPQ